MLPDGEWRLFGNARCHCGDLTWLDDTKGWWDWWVDCRSKFFDFPWLVLCFGLSKGCFSLHLLLWVSHLRLGLPSHEHHGNPPWESTGNPPWVDHVHTGNHGVFPNNLGWPWRCLRNPMAKLLEQRNQSTNVSYRWFMMAKLVYNKHETLRIYIYIYR